MIALSQLEPLPVFYEITIDETHLDALIRWLFR